MLFITIIIITIVLVFFFFFSLLLLFYNSIFKLFLCSQEAMWLRQLNQADEANCSHIVQLYSTFYVGPHFCLVMELLGRSLRQSSLPRPTIFISPSPTQPSFSSNPHINTHIHDNNNNYNNHNHNHNHNNNHLFICLCIYLCLYLFIYLLWNDVRTSGAR